MSTESTPTTHVYDGSCHCGFIKYKLRLTFPPIADINGKSIRIYKCNCNTCLKMNLFHLRPIEPSEDFVLTTPDISELGAYSCNDKIITWYFCKTCGVRPFALGGEWEQAELDVRKWAGETDAEGKMSKIWKAKGGEWRWMELGKEVVRPTCYLSTNAVTLEAGQEGLDLGEWHEKGWIFYFDTRGTTGEKRFGKPYDGGTY